MVGFLSEQRIMVVDIVDRESATLTGLAESVGTERRARSWRVPKPFEASLTVFINIVSAASDGNTPDFASIVKPAPVSSRNRTIAYCNLSLRIDQISPTDWDFRIFNYDASWGFDWVQAFADALGTSISRMATSPTTPYLRNLDPGEPEAGVDYSFVPEVPVEPKWGAGAWSKDAGWKRKSDDANLDKGGAGKKQCLFHQRGKCVYGTNCQYLHGEAGNGNAVDVPLDAPPAQAPTTWN